jgi:regulator of protease activity HflC (stomatin/prohibitin superfamily)
MFTLTCIIFIATIICLISLFLQKRKTNPDKEVVGWFGKISVIGIIITIIFLFISTITIIPAGEVGVMDMFGVVYTEPLTSGFHVINPLLSVHKMTIQTQNYTMSGLEKEGKKQGDDAIYVLSSDGLQLMLDITVFYSVMPLQAPTLYRTVGEEYEEKIIRAETRTAIRDMAVTMMATDIYGTKREEYVNLITESLKNSLEKRGVILEKVLLRNVELPAKVKAAIEEKIEAEQHAQQMVYVLQKERQEAERKQIEASGISAFQKIVAEGITPSLIEWKWIECYEKLATSPNTKVVAMPKQPFIMNF